MRTIIFKYYEHRHPLLGRHVMHDSRSLAYAFPTAGLQIKTVTHERHIPILDQGQVGSCTAESGIGNLATSPVFESLKSFPYLLTQAGAYHLYSDEETLDGDGPYPPNDWGSTGLTCARVLKKAGAISSYQHCFDSNSALLALSVTPFMFGCDWHQAMFNPDPDGRVRPQGPVEGGHEILCRGFDAINGLLWFDNSWGTGWGLQGRFYLTIHDFDHLLKKDGDVIILNPPSNPPPVPKKVRRHHHHHHHHRA